MSRQLRTALLFALALLVVGLAACGDDGGSSSGDDDLLVPDNPVQERWNNQSVNNAYDGAAENNGLGNNGGMNNGANNGGNNGGNNGANNGGNNGANNGGNNGANNGANNGGNNGANNGFDPSPNPNAGCGTAVESDAFRLLNQDRVENGLASLRCHDQLLAVARLHCKDMHDRQFFDHINPDGESPFDRMNAYGIRGWTLAGENIAFGYPTPAAVQAAWMDSPGHRANILTANFTHVGVGLYEKDGQLFWTQVFARF